MTIAYPPHFQPIFADRIEQNPTLAIDLLQKINPLQKRDTQLSSSIHKKIVSVANHSSIVPESSSISCDNSIPTTVQDKEEVFNEEPSSSTSQNEPQLERSKIQDLYEEHKVKSGHKQANYVQLIILMKELNLSLGTKNKEKIDDCFNKIEIKLENIEEKRSKEMQLELDNIRKNLANEKENPISIIEEQPVQNVAIKLPYLALENELHQEKDVASNQLIQEVQHNPELSKNLQKNNDNSIGDSSRASDMASAKIEIMIQKVREWTEGKTMWQEFVVSGNDREQVKNTAQNIQFNHSI